ncbi:hypothetical protein B0H67DRAFT_118950 [Lasiosphaeris hirsuta]|uniref:Uncharacterized protein n=1 Tax=Lasiosphaeris hirsuta TaxID=260670 RepID=A0AA40E1X8_9PEZI|nr:hypothetical protein B0H67DRAFT_118950 [Lasiosphaeris hirsuta]
MADGPYNDEQADAFFSNASLEAKDMLASLVYKEQLEDIRLATPFKEVEEVVELPLYDSEVDREDVGPGSGLALTTKKRGGNDRRVSGRNERSSGPGWMRLKLAEIRSDNLDGHSTGSVAFNLDFELRYASEIAVSRLDTLEPEGRETVAQHQPIFGGECWASYPMHLPHYQGLPLVEDVVFAVHPNKWSEEYGDGDVPQDEDVLDSRIKRLRTLRKYNDDWEEKGHSDEEEMPKLVRVINPRENYWTAVALLVYGDAAQWLRVKAEHLYLLRTILIFIVLYKEHKVPEPDNVSKIYNMKAYGEFNSRHVFLLKSQNRFFHPMVPNDYDATKFRLPYHNRWPAKYHLAFETQPPVHYILEPGVVDSEQRVDPELRGYTATSIPWPRFNACHLRYAVTYPPFSRQRLERLHHLREEHNVAEDEKREHWDKEYNSRRAPSRGHGLGPHPFESDPPYPDDWPDDGLPEDYRELTQDSEWSPGQYQEGWVGGQQGGDEEQQG